MLRGRNTGLRIYILIFANIFSPTCSWDRDIYAEIISFYFFDVACFLQNDMQKFKIIFLLKQFECIKCKATFKNYFFSIFGFFIPFWWEWQLALYMLNDFPGINYLNSLNNLSGLNDLYSPISSKNLYFKVLTYIFDDLLLFITWKRPLKVILNQFTSPF